MFRTIYKKSNHKVVGAGFDSLANYYTLGMKDEGINFTDKINFTGAASKKVINYYAEGVKKGYFRVAGSEHYLSGPFANEKVAMFIGTSAGEGFVKQGVGNKFTYDVAPRPGKYTMQQGTDIYMFKEAKEVLEKNGQTEVEIQNHVQAQQILNEERKRSIQEKSSQSQEG